MWFKFFIIGLLIAVIVSLFTAFYRLVRQKTNAANVDSGIVRALTVRIILSISVFMLLILAFIFGVIPLR